MILPALKVITCYNYRKIRHIVKDYLKPYNFANFSVMQMETLEQFLGRDLFLKVNALENAENLDELGNKRP